MDNLIMHADDALTTHGLRWDIFCQVVDNFGDLGVGWRLAVNLAQRGQRVRLWVDDASALDWMAPQGVTGVQVMPWTTPLALHNITPGDVLVEAFGCTVASEFIAAYKDCISARGKQCLWFNLEYLTAESYAVRCHGLPSPQMSGPGQGLTKHFFYPGFTTGTGGLLREAGLLAQQNQFDRQAWLTSHLCLPKAQWQEQCLVSLFCYEPTALAKLLEALAHAEKPTCLLITSGRASAAVKTAIASINRLQPLWNKHKTLSFYYLPKLTQVDFDHLLWACDVNFVRGEDSVVRALWAGKPFIWQLYPQHDGAHARKLLAFLDWLSAPESLRDFLLFWNGLTSQPGLANTAVPRHRAASSCWPEFAPTAWQACITLARQRLLQQDDLTRQLLEFVGKNI